MKEIIWSFTFYQLSWYFLIFAFLGWVSEVIFATLKTGKFINRGFLCGPVCPIYGCGVVIVMVALYPVIDNGWLLFLGGAILATILEFVTGFVLEKIFHTRWWDYSKEPFNIKGYICLRFTILWGLAIYILFNTAVAFVQYLVDKTPTQIGLPILIVLTLCFVADIVVTILQLIDTNKHFAELEKISALMHKGSDRIGEKVSEATIEMKQKAQALEKKLEKTRLAKAFPHLKEHFIKHHHQNSDKPESAEDTKKTVS